MDEPLPDLDVKLRVSMQAALNQLHDRLGITTVYVTHDQFEAMTLGDWICVPRDGGKSLWTARVSSRSGARSGQPLELAVDTTRLHFFDPASGESIGHPSTPAPLSLPECLRFVRYDGSPTSFRW